jgi:WxcM-like protein
VEILLDNPAQGLMIQSLMWREMYEFSEDCVLMVLADVHYDETDYIRDYKEFVEISRNGKE